MSARNKKPEFRGGYGQKVAIGDYFVDRYDDRIFRRITCLGDSPGHPLVRYVEATLHHDGRLTLNKACALRVSHARMVDIFLSNARHPGDDVPGDVKDFLGGYDERS